MAEVPAFHSNNPTDPDVYHVCSNCHYGQEIPQRNKRSRTGGYRLCQYCARLKAEGGC